MDERKTSFGALGAGALGVAAVALCCGGPLLIVAGGAVVAALGWAAFGIGAAVVVLAVVAGLFLSRARRGTMRAGAACGSAAADPVPRKL